MNGQYVNEEKYQKVIKILRVLRVLFLIIGAIVFIIGIVLVVNGTKDLSMANNDPWGDKQDSFMNSSMNMMIGVSMLGFGGMLMVAGGVALSIIIHRRELVGFAVAQNKPVVEEGYQAYKDIINEAVGDITSTVEKNKETASYNDPDMNHKFCKYCGNVLDNDALFCEYCGKKLN